jgi:hypothetical protein
MEIYRKFPMYQNHCTKQNSIYIPCILAIQLSKSNEKDDKVQTFIFDVLSPRDPFSSVICKDEFGDANPTFI